MLKTFARCLFKKHAFYISTERVFIYFLKVLLIFFYSGEGRKKERERNINVWLPLTRPLLATWLAAQAHDLDWESNHGPIDLQAGTQSTEPCQPKIK